MSRSLVARPVTGQWFLLASWLGYALPRPYSLLWILPLGAMSMYFNVRYISGVDD